MRTSITIPMIALLLACFQCLRAEQKTDSITLETTTFRLVFDSRGKPKSLLRLSDNQELLDLSDPGKGFYLYGMDLQSAEPAEIPLSTMKLEDGNRLILQNNFSRLTFRINIQPAYLAFYLERVEGVPTQNLLILRFELNVVRHIGLHPLDYMTYRRNSFGSTDGIQFEEKPPAKTLTRRVSWQWLWDRHPDNPLGGFALQCPRTEREYDQTLLQIWVNEPSLPKPAIQQPWTLETAQKWLEGWIRFNTDVRTITINGENLDELKEMVDFAVQEQLNEVKLFTHTWRGGFWPRSQHHLLPNPNLFPAGEKDFKAFCDYVYGKGLRLRLHTLSMCISNIDKYWVKTPQGPDPRLAHWVRGTLVDPVDKNADLIRFRPEPGSALPVMGQRRRIGSVAYHSFFAIQVFAIGKEFVRVEEFRNTDRDIWELKLSRRGLFTSEQTSHEPGENVTGYLRPYNQVFTADNNSTLIRELAKEFGEFCNTCHITTIDLDGLEVHGQHGYGCAKFGYLLYQYLDHYTASDSSSGAAMPFHMEYWFKAATRNVRPVVTMPLVLERSGRRATNPYEVHVKIARFVAEQRAVVGGIRKPEPMFDLTPAMLRNHGLSQRFLEQLHLWRKIAGTMSDEQRRTIAAGYHPIILKDLNLNMGNHKETDIIWEPRKTDDGLYLRPLSLLTRPGIDRGWTTGQE
ncbi:MAG: hypothetical protein D6820_00315, partial [Lentisphaerae bacterium]